MTQTNQFTSELEMHSDWCSISQGTCICVTQHLNHSALKWNPLFFHVSNSEELQNWFKAANNNAQQTWLHLSQSLPNHLSQAGFYSPIHHVHSLQRKNGKGGKGQVTLLTFRSFSRIPYNKFPFPLTGPELCSMVTHTIHHKPQLTLYSMRKTESISSKIRNKTETTSLTTPI